MNNNNNTIEIILRNKYLFSQVKYWIRRLDEEDHNKRTDLPRIYHYDHWSRVSDMLRNGHVGLLMDKLKRNINVSLSNDSVELICLKVKDLNNFKILYTLYQKSFVGENLVGCACRAGNPEIVEILLVQEYPTPLPPGACFQQAMSKGRYQVLPLLLARGLKYNNRYDTSRFGTFKFIQSLDWLREKEKEKDMEDPLKMVGHRLRKEVTDKITMIQKFKESFPHVDIANSEQCKRFLNEVTLGPWTIGSKRLTLQLSDPYEDIGTAALCPFLDLVVGIPPSTVIRNMSLHHARGVIDYLTKSHPFLMLKEMLSYILSRQDRDALPILKIVLELGFKKFPKDYRNVRKDCYEYMVKVVPGFKDIGDNKYADDGKQEQLQNLIARTSSFDLYVQHCKDADISRDIQQRSMVHGTLDFLKLIHKKHPEWIWKNQYAYASAMDSGRTDILDYIIGLIVSDGPQTTTYEETFESVVGFTESLTNSGYFNTHHPNHSLEASYLTKTSQC
ncbi:hypothetical protein DFA_00563 [Cavenderia fasciculata]|uniref:Ankyrin repeat-containing protein n=1 Tax=Cavenderia fasciculata TaxID=261658 RepID=F4PSL0_CACFS|nr:uncharacterized protein DFA_00563 [Cavenderia fasciculata]EGG20702.1 hypothetical protein DFA_00563 [Cavenderia fasciculata]|eukprot:XP_004358552.1 hypothetical protein DFA_00563 [Cavenderia fasciculata]